MGLELPLFHAPSIKPRSRLIRMNITMTLNPPASRMAKKKKRDEIPKLKKVTCSAAICINRGAEGGGHRQPLQMAIAGLSRRVASMDSLKRSGEFGNNDCES
ncbi:hypothetical protein EYF80_029776 [Liparis tanakae]|uniref:Uncharacterized protein n=1 Tax=Liparis tanakae TaxID=230148 RepID=A0A4Z2H2B9_9TELE|nr:hypothetical protein EYF80_029776 [Liparis tanakae]